MIQKRIQRNYKQSSLLNQALIIKMTKSSRQTKAKKNKYNLRLMSKVWSKLTSLMKFLISTWTSTQNTTSKKNLSLLKNSMRGAQNNSEQTFSSKTCSNLNSRFLYTTQKENLTLTCGWKTFLTLCSLDLLFGSLTLLQKAVQRTKLFSKRQAQAKHFSHYCMDFQDGFWWLDSFATLNFRGDLCKR